MSETIIQQGRFTSDGSSESIEIRSDADWMEVINETQFATTDTPGRGVKFEWQRGLTSGHAFEYTKADGTDVLQAEKVTSGGFTLVDVDVAGGFGPAVTGTTITKAGPPVCTANGHGFENGDIVSFYDLTEMPQIGFGYWSINNVAVNTFELPYFDTNTANFTQESAFTVRRIIGGADFVRGWEGITSVTTGATTQIQFFNQVADDIFSVGEVMRFNVPSAFGMVELSGLTGEVLSINAGTNTFTVDIDSTGFTAFAWPAPAAVPFTLASAQQVGNVSLGVSSGSTKNLERVLMKLDAGIDGPAGSSGDVIYWKTGKSTLVSNA